MNKMPIKTIISAWTAGVCSFVAWLVSLPPESQTTLIAPLISLAPLHWRDSIGLVTRLLASVVHDLRGIFGDASAPEVNYFPL